MFTLEQLQKIKKEKDLISWICATILIMPIMLLFFLPVVAQSLSILLSASVITFPGSTFYLTAYVVIPIIYCIIASLLFHPKRLVSPLHIQIGAVFLFVLYVIYSTFATSSFSIKTLDELLVNIFVMILIALVIGSIQFLFVRWVIGLNFNSIDRDSYIVNEKLNTVMKMLDGSFINSWNFKRWKDNPESNRKTWMLEHKDNEIFIIIAIGESQENKNKTIIATTAFKKTDIGIQKSEKASNKLKSIKYEIEGTLHDVNSKLTLIKTKDIDDFVSLRAFDYASSATRSKIDNLKKFLGGISKKFKILIYFTIISLFLISLICYLGYIDFNAYVSLTIGIIVAIIFPIVWSRKEELFRKKVEELDE